MSAAPELRRITRDQLRDEKFDGIEPLLNAFNAFCDQTSSLLSSNIDVEQNTVERIASVVFTTPADYATGGFPVLRVAWPFKTAVRIVNLGKLSGPVRILTPVSLIEWAYTANVSGGQVTIGYIAGLAPSTSYNANLHLL
jgi:hypothetical protein